MQPVGLHTNFGRGHRIDMPNLEPIVRAGGVIKSLAQVKEIAASIPLPAGLPLSLEGVIGLELVANPLFACVVASPRQVPMKTLLSGPR
jgi:hypothetical protein